MAREIWEVREAASTVEAADVKDCPRPGMRASAAEPRMGRSCTRLEKDIAVLLVRWSVNWIKKVESKGLIRLACVLRV